MIASGPVPSARRPETQSSRSASTADPGREPPGAATLQEVHSRPCFRFGSHHTNCTKRIFTSRSHHSPSRRGSRGEKNQERFSESSPKSAESPEPFWSSRRSLAARRKRRASAGDGAPAARSGRRSPSPGRLGRNRPHCMCATRVAGVGVFEGSGVNIRLQLWARPLPTGGHPPPFLLSVPELMFFKVLKLVYVPSFNEIVFVKKFCSLLSYDVQNPSQRPTVGMR